MGKAVRLSNPEETMSRASWSAELRRIGDERGFFEDLGREHTAVFVKSGRTLIVTFENLDDVYQNVESRLPWGFDFVQSRGWSILGLMAHEWSWYRDAAVLDFFDMLSRRGFFENFQRVVFYGASMGAYAAAAFSAAAPGATVIAISPQATLERDIAGWETRYRKAWRRDFSGRYGFAPEMVKAARRMYLFYDPMSPLDAMHAALFHGANVTRLKCRFQGHRIASGMQAMGILRPIVEHCVDGSFTEAEFYRLARARRGYNRYLRNLLDRLDADDDPNLTVLLCRHVLSRQHAPKFRRALKAATHALDERQRALPAARSQTASETQKAALA